eukprot:CAMPEP_0114534756 /NCGR_PEP_ID=MMETSP0109-20121206/28020_1 /TAXON_ID=29199 /ORGANISM="Chlorarachnion reptans, Strain CCCM449" /LENGTH=533 /DNA_ID=CAMNT_0001718211 /DNA_START=197 /DNA_END=1796 /DNA_ORIENTATION=-
MKRQYKNIDRGLAFNAPNGAGSVRVLLPSVSRPTPPRLEAAPAPPQRRPPVCASAQSALRRTEVQKEAEIGRNERSHRPENLRMNGSVSAAGGANAGGQLVYLPCAMTSTQEPREQGPYRPGALHEDLIHGLYFRRFFLRAPAHKELSAPDEQEVPSGPEGDETPEEVCCLPPGHPDDHADGEKDAAAHHDRDLAEPRQELPGKEARDEHGAHVDLDDRRDGRQPEAELLAHRQARRAHDHHHHEHRRRRAPDGDPHPEGPCALVEGHGPVPAGARRRLRRSTPAGPRLLPEVVPVDRHLGDEAVPVAAAAVVLAAVIPRALAGRAQPERQREEDRDGPQDAGDPVERQELDREDGRRRRRDHRADGRTDRAPNEHPGHGPALEPPADDLAGDEADVIRRRAPEPQEEAPGGQRREGPRVQGRPAHAAGGQPAGLAEHEAAFPPVPLHQPPDDPGRDHAPGIDRRDRHGGQPGEAEALRHERGYGHVAGHRALGEAEGQRQHRHVPELVGFRVGFRPGPCAPLGLRCLPVLAA